MNYTIIVVLLSLALCTQSSIHAQALIPVPQSGQLIRYENFTSTYIPARSIDVWLPANYTPQKKYAVLYMQDGQMLFDSTTTWNHQEWGVDETLTSLMEQKKNQRLYCSRNLEWRQKPSCRVFSAKAL